MSPSGLEPTPAGGHAIHIRCTHCGALVPLPPIARPAEKTAALARETARRINPPLARVAELEDATPTVAHRVDPRLAETDRIGS